MPYSRIALDAWESMFRATMTLRRELNAGQAWGRLSEPEYGVLYLLTKHPDGVRITDLGRDVLLTQTGLTRLAARLVDKGLVARKPDPTDGRSCLLVLTDEGRTVQRQIGRIHADEITQAMTRNLSEQQLEVLADLTRQVIA